MSGGLELRAMQPADLPFVRLQPAQRALAREMTPATAEAMRSAGIAFSVLEHGRPIAAAGLILSMGPPAIAWAVLSPAAGRHLVRLSAWCRLVLAASEVVETGVDPSFAAGRRWARLLGFTATGQPVERWDSPGSELWRRCGVRGPHSPARKD